MSQTDNRTDNRTEKLMPRNLSLEPKFDARRERWKLYIPPYLSSTGKEQWLFYKTKTEATTAADVFGKRQDNFRPESDRAHPGQNGDRSPSFRVDR